MITGVSLAEGVHITWAYHGRPHVWAIVEAVRQTAPERYTRITITSTNDGRHSAQSHHYRYEAFDFRTWELTPADVEAWAARTRTWLQMHAPEAHYDVVVESDHLHVEFDHWKE